MFRLFTSNTCTKGVLAREFLQYHHLPFEEVNLDMPGQVPTEQRLQQLFRMTTQLGELSLPLLAQNKADGQEEIVLFGFSPTQWQKYFLVMTESHSPGVTMSMKPPLAGTNTTVAQTSAATSSVARLSATQETYVER